MITRLHYFVALLLSGMMLSHTAIAAQPDTVTSRTVIEMTLDSQKPIIRGGIAFKAYCATCHGETADGSGRAARMYPGLRTRITKQTEKYYRTVILGGGTAGGMSEFMPPWADELSDEQVNDILAYLQVVTEPVTRGEVVFKTNCVLCHGLKGDGKGRAAKLYNPPPANLTASDKNTIYKTMIVTYGGEAMGRSPVMPVWGEQLSEQQIADVVAYIDTLVVAGKVAE